MHLNSITVTMEESQQFFGRTPESLALRSREEKGGKRGWVCRGSEIKYSLICSTFTGTLNQLHFILFIHLSSHFSVSSCRFNGVRLLAC